MSILFNPQDHLRAFAYLNDIPQTVVDTYLSERDLMVTYSDNWRKLATNDPDYVYRVTTLDPQGPGSILDALSYNGDETRHVIFDVAGTITLPERWWFKSKNIVVHGDTSPGGICITGAPMAFVDCENLTFNHLMWCLDEAPTEKLSKVWNPVKVTSDKETCRNITFDHCSIFGGDDENNFGPSHHYQRNTDVANDGVVVTNCIFGFGTRRWRGNHNFSLAVSFGKNMVIKNNLFLHNNKRNPQVYSPPNQCDEGGVIAGNVIYNYGSMGIGVIRGTFDIYNNTFIHGRNSKPKARDGKGFPCIKTTSDFQEDKDYAKLYLKNNKSYSRKRKVRGSDWDVFSHEAPIKLQRTSLPSFNKEDTLSADQVIATAGTCFNHELEKLCRQNASGDGSTWIKTMAAVGGVPDLPIKDQMYVRDVDF